MCTIYLGQFLLTKYTTSFGQRVLVLILKTIIDTLYYLLFTSSFFVGLGLLPKSFFLMLDLRLMFFALVIDVLSFFSAIKKCIYLTTSFFLLYIHVQPFGSLGTLQAKRETANLTTD